MTTSVISSYAYIHCKPDGTSFYVGKGVRGRYKNFKERNQHHKRIVSKYGQENILIGKLDCSSNDISLELEIGLIKCLRRMGYLLANQTDGGEGNVGWKCPDNVKQAVAKANKSRIWTQEQKHKIANLNRGKKRPEHSKIMKEKGLWAKENNPFFGKGKSQVGVKNHMARAVYGTHANFGEKRWDTLQDAAADIGVTIQAVFQAIKKSQRSKGWSLGYLS